MRKLLVEVMVVGSLLITAAAVAGEPGWEGRVIRFGAEREKVEQTDILNRSYRPLHFYGNTIRRSYYRGSPLPTLRDFARGSVALAVRR